MGQKTLFQISTEDAQFSAENRIGRKLTETELNRIESYLRYTFEDWGEILKNAVLKVTGKQELVES